MIEHRYVQLNHHLLQLVLSAQGEHHFLSGFGLLVQRPAGHFPVDVARQWLYGEIFNEERAGYGGEFVEPFFFDVSTFGLTC